MTENENVHISFSLKSKQTLFFIKKIEQTPRSIFKVSILAQGKIVVFTKIEKIYSENSGAQNK